MFDNKERYRFVFYTFYSFMLHLYWTLMFMLMLLMELNFGKYDFVWIKK